MKTTLFKRFSGVFVFTLTFFVTHAVPKIPLAENGILDLRTWDFKSDGPAVLDGQWKFYWEELLTPIEITKDKKSVNFNIVGLWNGQFESSNQMDGQGFATYHLRVRVPKNLELLALELPDMYSSYKLFVDGIVIAENGQVGVSRKSSVAQWLPQTVIFKPKGTLINIVLQVSNFSHHRGGLNDHIYLGTAEQMINKRESAVITNIMLTGGLSLIGFFFIILFFFFKKDRAALYFAALCITWAIRSVLTNLYLFIKLFPNFDWELAVKIEYLTLYLTMMWVIMFASKMFPFDTHKISKRILLIANGIFIALTLATPAVVYTQLLGVYTILAWALLAYVAYIIIRALIFGRPGAQFTTVSILLGIAMFSYDMLTYREVFDFNPFIFNVGYMTIFFLNATAIAYQLSIEKPRSNDEQLSFEQMKMRDAI